MQASSVRAHLIPFGVQSLSHLSVETKVERKGNLLSLEYLMKGSLEEVLFPFSVPKPSRLDQLWEHTCYEAFITWGQNTFYWELNLSPSGDWNFYFFDSYRSGQKREERVALPRAEIIEQTERVQKLKLTLDLDAILPERTETRLALGITTVIEKKDHSKTYWALSHLGPKPDFHLRNSFILGV